MVTVSNSLQIVNQARAAFDSFSATLNASYCKTINRTMNNSLSYVNNSTKNIQKRFELFKVQINKGIDTKSIDAVTKSFSDMAKSMDVAIKGLTQLKTQSGKALNTDNTNIAAQKAEKLNDSKKSAGSGVNGLAEKIKSVKSAVMPKADLLMNLSDSYAKQNVTLDSIRGQKTREDARNQIFTAARNSRSSYDQTLNTVSRLKSTAGGSFKSTDEAIYFTEMMNKAFAGTDDSSKTASIDAIVKAMQTGTLKGDDLASVINKAPVLADAVKQYTGSPVNYEKGVSADIFKNSVYNSASTINDVASKAPVTFAGVWNSIKESALQAFGPILQKIGEITQNKSFQTVVNGICTAFSYLNNLALSVFGILSGIAGFVVDNWSGIGPIILGIAAAMAVYKIAAMGSAVVTAIATGIKQIAEGATIAETVAQWGLNSALLACPLVWIILLIIALIVIIYLVVAAINKFAGTSISATGVVAGVFAVLGTNIYNTFAYMWNYVAAFVEFFQNVFTNPVYSVKKLFVDVFSNILDYIKTIASAIDMVFHTNLAGNITSLKNDMNSWLGKMPESYKIIPRLQMKDLKTAYDTGYNFGEKLQSSFSMPQIKDKLTKAVNPDKYIEPIKNTTKTPTDPAALSNYYNNQQLQNNIANTAANTGAMKNTMDVTQEDLKYMRDIAEQEVINRFTTSEIKVDMTNHNNINSNLDLDGVVSYMEQKVYETMSTAAEGVHI